MLFLGMGTAFAGYFDTDPEITPSSGSSVTKGQEIVFTVPDDLDLEDYSFLAILYSFDEDCMGFSIDATTLQAFYNAAMGQGTKPVKNYEVVIGVIDGKEVRWTNSVTVPTDAETPLSFMARMCALKLNGTTIDRSEDIEATFIVAGGGEVVKPAMPTFSPASGEVEPATKVAITAETDEIWYVIDGSDEDLTMAGYMAGKCQAYENPIEIYKGQTIKAIAVGGDYPSFVYSDVATATYTVKGGDVERTDIPKLTLSPAAVTVPAAGQAVFSCTVDPQEYTHKKDLVAYVFSGKPGDIAKLEYQVGEKVNPNAWISYPEKDWSNFGTGAYVSVIPNNTDNKDNRLFLIENGAQTVHYRLTLKLKEGNSTAPEMTFAAVAVSDFGAWSILNAEDPLAKAAVTFTVDETAKPTVAANPVFDPASGEIEPNTTVTITSATPGVQIAYVAVNDGDEDKTIDLSDAGSYAVYSGGLWMVETKPVTLKALAFRRYEDGSDKILQSAEVTAHYTFPKVAAPTFSRLSGTNVEYGEVISIYGTGDIYYTTDGTEPTTASTQYYGNPISLDKGFNYGQDVTIKAIAVVDGDQSKVATATYHIKLPSELAITPDRPVVVKGETFAFEMTMTANDYVGTALSMGIQMIGYEALKEFKFRKKGEANWTDILTPVVEDEGTAEKYLSYKADDITWEFEMAVLEETDVDEVMFSLGFRGANGSFCGINKEWNVVSLAIPTFSPAAGTVAKNTAVTLSTAEEDAEIRYTTDGSEPTAQSTQYTAPISITTKTTVKAVTVKYGLCSKVAEAVYTLVATPAFSASGVVERNTAVTLNCATAGAKIYYTVDGSEPTAASTEYTAAITVDRPMTVKAVAVLDGEQSLVAEAVFVFVKAPEFSEEAGSKVLQNTELTLTAAEGAKIYYTIDGSEPTVQSTQYTAPIKLERKTTVKAIAVVGDETSFVAEATYRVQPIAPTFSIPAGSVESGTTVELTAVGDAQIRFSVLGTVNASSAVYKTPIRITSEKTISAAAFLDDEMSEIVTAKYTVNVNKPVFTPTPGAVEAGTKVTIEAGNASIRYTTDGTDPDKDNGRWYNPNAGIIINEATTIKAYAIDGSEQSEIVTAIYWIIGGEVPEIDVATPTFSVAAGEVEKGTAVEIGCVTLGAAIYYTVDGSEPTAQSTQYTEAVVIDKSLTLKAIAIIGDNKSEVATAAYTVNGEETVAAPTFSVKAGEVEKGTKVSIACETEGAIIYYTVDGAEPTAESTEYKEAIVIDKAMTVKAIAIKGEAKSEVVTAAYTVKTANEDEELAGVSVYPNPSNGLFNIELPVAATIEVFASNGVLTQRVNANAGVATLTVNRSGIYFLRITGEGRAVIKRIIVR